MILSGIQKSAPAPSKAKPAKKKAKGKKDA